MFAPRCGAAVYMFTVTRVGGGGSPTPLGCTYQCRWFIEFYMRSSGWKGSYVSNVCVSRLSLYFFVSFLFFFSFFFCHLSDVEHAWTVSQTNAHTSGEGSEKKGDLGGTRNYQLFHDDDKTKKNENVAASCRHRFASHIYTYMYIYIYILPDFTPPTYKSISIAPPRTTFGHNSPPSRTPLLIGRSCFLFFSE